MNTGSITLATVTTGVCLLRAISAPVQNLIVTATSTATATPIQRNPSTNWAPSKAGHDMVCLRAANHRHVQLPSATT
jgi:hypothetical protein